MVLGIGSSADLFSTMWTCAYFEVLLLAAAVLSELLGASAGVEMSPISR
jgi:hypothetical protein